MRPLRLSPVIAAAFFLSLSTPSLRTTLSAQTALPNGIVLPRGDSSLRLAVNTGLAQVYGGDEIVEIFRRWFGALGRPSAVLESAYILGTIPE